MSGIKIKTLQQKTFEVDIEHTETVRALKEKIEEDKGMEFQADLLKLIYAGKILEDSQPLSKYKIQPSGFVVVVVSKSRPPPKPAAEESSEATTTSVEASTTAQETSTKCPTLGCHAHGDLRYSPDWCARKDIEKLEVTCPRREKGCTWEGKLSNLGSHQKDVCKLQNPSICGETIIHDEIDTPLADCTKMMEMKNQKESSLSRQHDCHGEYIKFNALFNESAETRSAIHFDEDLPNPQPASTNHSFRHTKTALSVVFESDIHMARVTQSISTSKLEQICIKRDMLRDQVVSLQESQSETVKQNYQRLRSESGNYDGTILWKIKNFKVKLADAQSGKYTSIFSLPFYSGQYGYKMCLKLYFMGDGIGKNTHMSLFFVIMKGEFDSILKWPFTSKVTFKLINQTGNRDIIDTFQPDPMSSSFQKPKSDMNIVSGCPQFVTHSELNLGGFIVTDTVFIKCIVDKCA